MPHPWMFEESDPILRRVRMMAMSLPGAAEKISHGHPAFFTTKVFAYYAGAIKVDGAYVHHRQSVLVLPDEEEARALLEEERCYRPAYLGPSGWVGVDLDETSDWTEVGELLEESFRRTAGARRVAELDAR